LIFPEIINIFSWEEKMEKDILTRSEVCELLQISQSTLQKLITKKEIPFVKINRTIRFSRKEILEWFSARSTFDKVMKNLPKIDIDKKNK